MPSDSERFVVCEVCKLEVKFCKCEEAMTPSDRDQKRTKLFERRWIERGDGLPPDLESTTYLSRTGRRVTVRLWRTVKDDAVLLHQYRIPGCKRCRRTRLNHHSSCPFYKRGHTSVKS